MSIYLATKPNWNDLKHEFQEKLNYISRSCKGFDSLAHSDQFNNLEEMLKLSTELTCEVCIYHRSQKKKLESLSSQPTTLGSPDKAISSCKTNMYTLNSYMDSKVH